MIEMDVIVYKGKIPIIKTEIVQWEEYCRCPNRDTATEIAATMAEHDGYYWYMYYHEDGVTEIKF